MPVESAQSSPDLPLTARYESSTDAPNWNVIFFQYLLPSCSIDDEEDLVGNWVKVSDFDGVSRCSAVTFTAGGQVYVATGGYGGSKRMGASAFVIDGTAYVVGGENNSESVTDFWAFDPDTETWTEKREISNVSDDDYDDDYSTIARSYGVAFTMYGLGYLTCGENAGSGRMGI